MENRITGNSEMLEGSDIVLVKKGNFFLIRHTSAFFRCHLCHVIKAKQQKSVRTPDVKSVNKDNRCFPANVHKAKKYSSSDKSKHDSEKEEDNTSNSEIKEEVY